jgi:hypothetical protein
MERPDKFKVDEKLGFSVYTPPEIVAKINQIIDFLETATIKNEVKSFAYTFLGHTANIRCGEEIKTVNVFRGDERFEFTLPPP